MGIEFFRESEVRYGAAEELIKDLNLQWIARNMAHDNYADILLILEVLQHPLMTNEEIRARQDVVMAACGYPEQIKELRKRIVGLSDALDQSMQSVQDSRGKHLMEQTVIGLHLEGLRELVRGLSEIRGFLEKNKEIFEQTALRQFAQEFCEEEPDDVLEEQQALTDHLDSFKDRGEILLSAGIGKGFMLRNVEVLSVSDRARRAGSGIFTGKRGRVLADEEVYQSGVEFTNRILMELLERCVPFMQRWQELLHTMKRQVVFLNGCAHLFQKGQEMGMPFCLPDEKETQADKIYELALALQSMEMPIVNTVEIARYPGIIVTGANQGGKSTFLRSLGIAQVFCQAGMYVPAKAYPLHAYRNIFTHFTRREDAAMNMGKFEEELKRMEDILRGAKENTLILLNESFATTTEVTAYQIAMDLLHVCMDCHVTTWMVTHITKFAKALYQEKRQDILFLSAGHQADGEVRFMMYEKVPGDTSYGLELYEKMIEGR